MSNLSVVFKDGFDFHLTLRTGVKIIPVTCASLWRTVSSSLLHALDAAHESAPEPARIRAVIFTNPHNPFGQCYPKDAIREVLRWCGRKRIHFVGDEVYGLSEFKRGKEDEGFVSALSLVSGAKKKEECGHEMDGNSPYGASEADSSQTRGESDAAGKVHGHAIAHKKGASEANNPLKPYQSSGRIDEESDIDLSRIHTIWSLSKDLGSSGLRIVSPPCSSISPEARAYTIPPTRLFFTGNTRLTA